MKSGTLILCLTLLILNTSFFTSIEATDKDISFPESKNSITQNETISSNLDENIKLRSTGGVLDCFGVGEKFAATLDSFLKDDANGTNALKIKFYASSRNFPEGVILPNNYKFNISELDFNIKRKTFFIVHGFLAQGTEEWIVDMKEALMEWDNVNVFIVDWSDGSNTWNYYKAAVNTRTVGDQIATFIGNLIDATMKWDDVDPNSFGSLHLIGHSLGAHICGYAAYENQKRKHKWTVQRITGLDPAQPCFKNTEDKLRLDKNDAPFVDIIHTNGRTLSKFGLGLPYPIGHVDFYPNGGEIQPGCALSSSSIMKYLPLPIETITQTICSHGRSYLYFTDSVVAATQKSCSFWSHEWNLSYAEVDSVLDADCSNTECVELGINSEKYTHNGSFFTFTGSSRPFCRIDDRSKSEVKNLILKTIEGTEVNG